MIRRVRKAWNGGSPEAALAAAHRRTEEAIAAGCPRCPICQGDGGQSAAALCPTCGGAGCLVPAAGMPLRKDLQPLCRSDGGCLQCDADAGEACKNVRMAAQRNGIKLTPLAERPGLTTSCSHKLIDALSNLARQHGLIGCVLVSFTDDRVAVNSCGEPAQFGRAMEELADRILIKIDDGELDPTSIMPRDTA
jgi:hypothetical protein